MQNTHRNRVHNGTSDRQRQQQQTQLGFIQLKFLLDVGNHGRPGAKQQTLHGKNQTDGPAGAVVEKET